MTSEQWQLAKNLYAQVESLAANSRADFLHRHCADEEVCALVAQMLGEDKEEVETFLENSPLSVVRQEIEAEANLIEKSIGGYTLKTRLGQGGMGVVYLGSKKDEDVEHQAAIKLLRSGFSSERLRRERKILASLNHPNIARLIDSDTTNQGLPYLVMEYVSGLPITEHCDQKKCSIPERLEIFRKVCAAVEYAHKKLVIHRDLKPGNILVTEEDQQVKVLDFGIAKLIDPDDEETFLPSREGRAAMTVEYASPEQLSEQSISTVSDVYSLGVLLYELLTGHRPYKFPSRSSFDALRIITEASPKLPSQIVFETFTDKKEQRTAENIAEMRGESTKGLSQLLRGDLDTIVLKALRAEPDQRYGSVGQLSADITHYLNDEPIVARKPSLVEHTSRVVRHHKAAVIMGAIIFLIVSAWLISYFRQTAREREQAQQVRRKLYAAEIQQAMQSWENDDLLRTKKTLEHWLPQAGEEDFRGFEWRYLWGLANPGDLTVTMPDDVFQAWHLPDENRLYVRDVSGKRKVFDTVTGQELWGYQDQTNSRATPDWPLRGEVIALEEGNRVVVWDVIRGLKKSEFTVPGVPLKLISQLDETRIFTSDERGEVKIRERLTGKVIHEIAGTGIPYTSVTVMNQFQALALVTDEKTVAVHFLDGSRPTFTFTEAHYIKAIWPDIARQRILLHVGEALVIRDAFNGKLLQTIQRAGKPINRLGLFGNSNFLFLLRNDHSIQILDANSLREKGVLRGHNGEVYFQEFLHDINWLITSSTDHTAKIWDVTTQKEIATFRGHVGDVTSALVSQDRKKLITGSRDHTARIWDIAQARQPNILTGHTDHILTAAFSPDNRHVATAGKDSIAIISDIQSGAQISLPGHKAMIFTVAFSPDGKQLATGSYDGTAKLWDTETGREVMTIPNGKREYVDGVRSLTFTHDGQKLIAGCNDGMIKVWETASGKLLTQFRAHKSEVLSVSLSPDGQRLSSGGADRAAKLWDTQTWQELASLPGHKGWVWATEFSPDGKQLATGCGDYKIRLWDVTTAQEIRTLEGHSDGIFSVSFTPDGKRLASCSDDKTVRIWNPATGEELLTLRDHTDEVWRVAFSPGGTTLLSASWDKTARLYRAAAKLSAKPSK